MNMSSLQEIIRDRIYRKNGKEAQQLVWDILIKHYPDLQTVKMQHDLGNDGYSIDGKLFIACYFPESAKYDNDETKDKIDGDYKKFVDNWKSKLNGNIEKWIFLTKDNLMGTPHQKIADLNSNNDGVKKEQWGVDKLVELCVQLPEQVIKQIFNLEDTTKQHFENNAPNHGTQILAENVYMQSEKEESEDLIIIDEIFSHVLKVLEDYDGSDKGGYVHLEEKIELNFRNEDDRNAVASYFNFALTKVKLIEQRVQVADGETQNDLQGHVFGKYYELKSKGLNNMDILHELFTVFIPAHKERDSRYVNLAKAFVLFYFEDCTIFEKTKTEGSK